MKQAITVSESKVCGSVRAQRKYPRVKRETNEQFEGLKQEQKAILKGSGYIERQNEGKLQQNKKITKMVPLEKECKDDKQDCKKRRNGRCF